MILYKIQQRVIIVSSSILSRENPEKVFHKISIFTEVATFNLI